MLALHVEQLSTLPTPIVLLYDPRQTDVVQMHTFSLMQAVGEATQATSIGRALNLIGWLWYPIQMAKLR